MAYHTTIRLTSAYPLCAHARHQPCAETHHLFQLQITIQANAKTERKEVGLMRLSGALIKPYAPPIATCWNVPCHHHHMATSRVTKLTGCTNLQLGAYPDGWRGPFLSAHPSQSLPPFVSSPAVSSQASRCSAPSVVLYTRWRSWPRSLSLPLNCCRMCSSSDSL